MSHSHNPATAQRIAFISAHVHDDIVERARQGFDATVVDRALVDHFSVPGAFELPLHARTVAATMRYDGVVAAGFVVDGGIYRHEFVSDAVIKGLMRVQLDSEVPVFSCVLTPQNFHDHLDHHTFFSEHMYGKGVEVAHACLDTLDARRQLAIA